MVINMEYLKTYLTSSINIDGIYTVHYFEYAKDFSYSGEIHDFWELVYADKKSLYITAGADEIVLEAGSLYLHKPNEFHNIRCNGKQAANSVVISFDCDANELFSVAGKVIAINEEMRQLIGTIIKESKQAFSNPLGNPYTKAMEKSMCGEYACEQMICISIERLLICLLRANGKTDIKKPPKSNSLLGEISDYLRDNVENKLSFNDITKKFSLSASVLKKEFSNHMNCGVMEYFTRLKIDAAKEMIREENLNFTEIAQKLSFSSSQYFTTVFKRISGMTPTEYSNSIISKPRM